MKGQINVGDEQSVENDLGNEQQVRWLCSVCAYLLYASGPAYRSRLPARWVTRKPHSNRPVTPITNFLPTDEERAFRTELKIASFKRRTGPHVLHSAEFSNGL